MNANDFLLIFAAAFTLCVLSTPLVTHLARWAGAIDKPDNNRKVHAGATPRMGGLALAVGLFAGMIMAAYLQSKLGIDQIAPNWASHQVAVWVASVVILIVGVLDDTQELRPRAKLAGQTLAVMVLYFSGIRIEKITTLGMLVELNQLGFSTTIAGAHLNFSPASFFFTWFWFIACMNIWNLIDGMDGLASGVGLLVSGTLTVIALHGAHMGPAALSVALSGGLAGFLLYNWHPACIFLGDSGSLLIGLLVGVIGVEGSLKGPSAVSILFPILAMGLPISDTAMAIFRRWVRNLPLSAADRRHIHHLLIGLGLNPRQAAVLLYCFSGFLCGVVLLGLAFNHEFLALTLGLSGCMAFLIVLMSRRDELSTLRSDLNDRMSRGKMDRKAAVVCFTTIQKQEICKDEPAVWRLFTDSCQVIGVARLDVTSQESGERLAGFDNRDHETDFCPILWQFRFPLGEEKLVWQVGLNEDVSLDPDIIHRYVHRMVKSTIAHVARLRGIEIVAEPVGLLARADLDSGDFPIVLPAKKLETA